MAKGCNLVLDNELYCVICGSRGFTIPRKRGAERESGHLKKLFCLHCQKETNHAECRPWTKYNYNDFLAEYRGGNFDEDGNRVKPYGLFKNDNYNNLDLYPEK